MAPHSVSADSGRLTPDQSPLLAGFDQRLSSLLEQQATVSPTVEGVAEVVKSLIGSLDGDLVPDDLHLYREVEGLADFIRAARAEIIALNPNDIREDFLPTATDELDAIVQATEQATGSIMDATEAIEDVAGRLDEANAQALQDAVTCIYEACSFQDITGQRITKVVRMMKVIEERVSALVLAFAPQSSLRASVLLDTGIVGGGDEGASIGVQDAANYGRSVAQAVGDHPDDAALLNGPQSSGDAMGQDDIDALLKGFD